MPFQHEQERKEVKDFLDDLTTRDQRMILVMVSLVHVADSKEQLDNDTESLLSVARKHLCQFATLSWQQGDGLNTVMPYGLQCIEALRTMTTEKYGCSHAVSRRRRSCRRAAPIMARMLSPET